MHHTFKLEQDLPNIFTLDDLTGLLKIKRESTRVLASRLLKRGIIQRIKRNLYVVTKKRLNLTHLNYLQLAEQIVNPSYISFRAALIYHGVGIGGKFAVESACLHQSNKTDLFGLYHYAYHRLPQKLFFGYGKNAYGILIATPEKALLDILYMMSLGRYFIHFNSVSLENLSFTKLLHYSKKYPQRTQKLLFRLFKRSIKRK